MMGTDYIDVGPAASANTYVVFARHSGVRYWITVKWHPRWGMRITGAERALPFSSEYVRFDVSSALCALATEKAETCRQHRPKGGYWAPCGSRRNR